MSSVKVSHLLGLSYLLHQVGFVQQLLQGSGCWVRVKSEQPRHLP